MAEPVVVAGGGWAGLAAAVELAACRVPVVLLESSRQLGGRARRIPFGREGVDNGQHLLVGAYRETLRLIALVGVQEKHALLRLPLRLEVLGPAGKLVLAAPSLPAPLHLASALLMSGGLSLAERAAALSFATGHFVRRFKLAGDKSVAALISDQPHRLRAQLWEPLCLATLNTDPAEASAEVFLRVLRDAFARRRADSDLLIPRLDLGRVFPEPAFDFIEKHGGRVELCRKVTALETTGDRVTGVCLGHERLAANAVVLATPPAVSGRLLAPHPAGEALARVLARLGHEPIVTVYLRYPPAVQLSTEMVGLTGGLAQWLFDRRVYGQPGLLAAVISGPGQHMALDREALVKQIAGEVAANFPAFPAPEETLVVREKRATFRCDVGVNSRRPTSATPVEGCFLAGDYTATGYPATLEGAVRSGIQCARLVNAHLGITTS